VGRRVKSASRLVSVGAASLAKASSEGWRLRLRPNKELALLNMVVVGIRVYHMRSSLTTIATRPV
jgi:hypothetical protein